jgi:uncharacterized protein with von Willebrand factor type A (vWA) domain
MENAIHRFVRLLRLRQVRISIPEALDAMACAGQPGMLADRAHLKAALRVALIKDRRDEEVFDEVFDRFFALVKVGPRRRVTATGTVTRTSPTPARWRTSRSPRNPAIPRNRATATASRSTSATTSTPRTSPSSTTCTRRRTRSTWPR